MPEDNDEVCDICKEMVKEARDQLRSNETLVSTIYMIECMSLITKCTERVGASVRRLVRLNPHQDHRR